MKIEEITSLFKGEPLVGKRCKCICVGLIRQGTIFHQEESECEFVLNVKLDEPVIYDGAYHTAHVFWRKPDGFGTGKYFELL